LANDEQATELQRFTRVYEEDWETETDADVAIHRYMAQCAVCPLLSEELNRLLLIERTAGGTTHDAAMQPGRAHIHRALVQAIVDRDADSAEYLMKKHIQDGYQEVMREFEDER